MRSIKKELFEIKELKELLEYLDSTSELYSALNNVIKEKEMESKMDVKELIYFALSKRGYGIESNNDTGIVTVSGEDGKWDFTIPLKMKITPQQYKFLCELRRSGKTNMFEAGKFIIEEFSVTKEYANEILKEWMNKFTAEDY